MPEKIKDSNVLKRAFSMLVSKGERAQIWEGDGWDFVRVKANDLHARYGTRMFTKEGRLKIFGLWNLVSAITVTAPEDLRWVKETNSVNFWTYIANSAIHRPGFDRTWWNVDDTTLTESISVEDFIKYLEMNKSSEIPLFRGMFYQYRLHFERSIDGSNSQHRYHWRDSDNGNVCPLCRPPESRIDVSISTTAAGIERMHEIQREALRQHSRDYSQRLIAARREREGRGMATDHRWNIDAIYPSQSSTSYTVPKESKKEEKKKKVEEVNELRILVKKKRKIKIDE